MANSKEKHNVQNSNLINPDEKLTETFASSFNFQFHVILFHLSSILLSNKGIPPYLCAKL